MDALHMDFPDDTFDLVWACESGEHMPDKKLYIEEMTRVLKPGKLCLDCTQYGLWVHVQALDQLQSSDLCMMQPSN